MREVSYGEEIVYQKNRVEIVRVTPQLYFRRGDMPVRRQSNGAFLVLGEVVATVDATTIEAAEEMLQEAVEVFGHPLRYVFLTHGDGDHVAGLPVFLAQPLTIFCSHGCSAMLFPKGTMDPLYLWESKGCRPCGWADWKLSCPPYRLQPIRRVIC